VEITTLHDTKQIFERIFYAKCLIVEEKGRLLRLMEHNSDGNKSNFACAIGASPQAALLSDLRTPPMQQETLTSVALQPLLSPRFQYALIESFDKSIYTMIDPEKTELEEFLKEYARVRCNAVFFVENYWNKLHSDKPIILTDDEKQQLYNKYRIVPLVQDFTAYTKRLEELRAKGYKDWEIDA
jgi:hypothetical protein